VFRKGDTVVHPEHGAAVIEELCERVVIGDGSMELVVRDRYRSLVAGWLSSRLREYLPLEEADGAYSEPLFDADEQNLEPG